MNEKAETKNKKKNGAHTNSCTTVQLEERNIHVGCCLFSHNPKTNITKNNNRVVDATRLNWLCLQGFIEC